MSENYDSEQVLEGFAAGENEGSNGFIPVEPPVDISRAPSNADSVAGSAVGEEVPVFVDPVVAADLPDSADQEPSSLHVDHNNGDFIPMDDPNQHGSNDVKISEDGGKEDMFVDCPDELTTYDGKNTDNREAIEIPETQQGLQGKDDTLETSFNESHQGMHVNNLMAELEHLPMMLRETVSNKESFVREYEEERRSFMKGLANLHHQLKALNVQQSFNENDGSLVDHLHRAEIGEVLDKSLVTDAPLHEMINESSKFLKNVLDKQSQTEDTIRELQEILHMKDQDIEELSARLTELSLSREVVLSYLNSTQENWSQSSEVPSEVQLLKDQHIDATANRMLASLATVVNKEELLDESVTGKLSHVEKSTSLLIERYNWFLSEINLLRQCLTEVRSDPCVQDGMETIFVTAHEELRGLKSKEVDLSQKVNHAEDENRKLVEELEKGRQMVEMASAEISKLKAELEQEKTKYGNTKEKLSLAVTKGKALVQQRDLLKQLLADKTNELEKCLIELQEKSSALEAAELSKESLIRSENLVASLQEALSQRDTIVVKCEEILSETGRTEELQSMDIIERVRCLAHERSTLKDTSLEFHKLRDALLSIDLPETVDSSDLEPRVNWLLKSFYLAKDEAIKLQDEIARIREVAHSEIDLLTTSLLAEAQEKNYLQLQLEDLTHRYEGVVENEHRVSLEKDQIVSLLLEASGITVDSQEEVYQPHSDGAMIINRCIEKIKEQASASLESSHGEVEIFERIQSLLYIRDQETNMFEQILEEEMMDRSQGSHLSNELAAVSQELHSLKDEKGSLRKDLERSEEKATLLREKLSMAVKKGKGLVLERENLRQLLDEKNAEIENLKLELQQQESALNDCRDQVNRLSADAEQVPNLEADLVAMKDQRDQLEQFLAESNTMLQRVIDSIDSITLPVDSVFEEPVEKVKWLAGYLSECQAAKTQAEEELGNVKDEASILASNLAEVQATMKSLEDALSAADNNLSLLAGEKRELEVAKSHVEHKLQNALEETSSQTSKFAEVCETRKSLEDAFSLAENRISMLISETEEAQISRAAADMELQKVKEEVSIHTSKLDEAYKTIQSLEDALSQAQKNISLLAKENNKAQFDRTNLENEITKLKKELDLQSSKVVDASSTIKSLEDALSKAENNISDLVDEKRNAEQDISALNSKLTMCMQELAGSHGNIENRSLELAGHINSLQLLLKDESLLSSMIQSFKKKFENLKDMDLLIDDVRGQVVEVDSEMLESHPLTKEDNSLSNLFPAGLDNTVKLEMANGEVNAADSDNIMLYMEKTVDGFHLRNKLLAEKFKGCSTSMDELIAALLKKLQATRDKVTVLLNGLKSLKQEVNDMEKDKQMQEKTIVMLENDITILLSACTNASQELESEMENNLLELSSIPEHEKLKDSLSSEVRAVGEEAVAEHQLMLDGSKYAKTVANLSFAARNVRNLSKQFQNVRNTLATTIEDLQSRLKETRTTCEKALEEKDLNQNRVSELETDLEASQELCSEMRIKLEDYQAKLDKLTEREAELSLLHVSLMKEQDREETLLSASQVKSLFEKINGIEIPYSEIEIGDTEPNDSAHVKKLFYIIDSVTGLQHQITLLSHDKEKMQSTLAEQVCEIEFLKEEVEECVRDKEDLGKMKNELFKVTFGLENIIQKLGGDELVGDQKSADVMGLLPVLEKLVTALILEAENSKSKAQELGAKLLGTQKVVDELLIKVKSLEDLSQGRAASPETVQERGIFEASSLPTRSEISEIEDVAPLGKKTIPPVSSAAHVRTSQKGSSEHLAINVDSESDRLVANEEANEDKGHVFKSLNTSGLIPTQGKMIADRIDGIWVSAGGALTSRPRARLGLIAYWLVLHMWLLGTIL